MTEIIHHAINEHLPLYLDHCGLPHFNPTSSKNPCMYSAGIIMELYKEDHSTCSGNANLITISPLIETHQKQFSLSRYYHMQYLIYMYVNVLNFYIKK